jgi:predicted amidohydrolase
MLQSAKVLVLIFFCFAQLNAQEKRFWGGEKAETRFRLVCVQQGEDYRDKGNKCPIENLRALFELSREGAKQHPNVIVFPEYATTGVPYPEPEFIRSTGEQIPGQDTLYTMYRDLATELQIPIIGWMVEKEHDNYYNTAFLLDKNGKYVNKYRKVQTNLREQNIWGFSPGDAFKIFEIDSCKLGLSICSDMWFPETVMCLSLMNADMILHLSVGDDMGWVIPTRARDHFIPIVAAINVHGSWGVDQWGEMIRKGSRNHEYNVFDVYPFRQVITERLGGWYPKMGRRAFRNPKAYKIITDMSTITPMTDVFCDPVTGQRRSKEELLKRFPKYRGN